MFRQGFILKTLHVAVRKRAIKVETITKGMTASKSLSFRVGMIFLSVWFFVLIGYSEAFGTKLFYSCENPLTCRYFCQPSIVDASKNFVTEWIESVYKETSSIEIGAKLGRRWYPKSESMPIILLVGVAVWGAAIIFVLGLIFYRIVIEPFVQKKRVKME